MKSDKLQDAIGEIRDDYILDAHGEHGEMKGKKRYPQVAAVLLLLLLVNIIMDSEKYTVLPCPSVRRPSSKI